MNTLRWLMKHPIVLAWLLALLAILLNFGVGGKGGEEHAAKEGAKKAAHHAVAEQHKPAAQALVAKAETATEEKASATESKPVEAEKPAATESKAEEKVAAVEPVPAPPAAEAKPAEVVKADAPKVEEAAKVEAAVPASGAEAPIADSSSEADLLRAAREAYWSSELDRSVSFYTSLLKKVPDSLQYKGELANVYWKQGDTKQASTLFTEIAPQLAAQGRMAEALNMKLYVDMVEPTLAKTIDAALSK